MNLLRALRQLPLLFLFTLSLPLSGQVNSISLTPQTATTAAGGSLTLTATVDSATTTTGAAVYWACSGGSFVSTNSNTVTWIAPTTPGVYSVTATAKQDAQFTATSSITVINQPPAITTHPANATVTAGQTASFSVSASGTAPLGYQWQRYVSGSNGGYYANITGATSATYTTPATSTADSGSSYRVVVSNSAGSATSNAATLTVNPALQPPNPSYSPSSQTFTVGTAITAWTPSNAGGTAASWSISPALPAGLSFSSASGTISGTPSATSATTSYTVTATNAAGNGTTTITVTVNPALQPPNPSYSSSSQTFTVGTAITAWTPSNAGGTVASWSISPALPAGLGFSTASGTISGTPSATSATTSYTVTASNAAGNGTTTITVTVNPALQPPNPSYSPTSQTFTVGTAIATWTPSNAGGTAASWSISPALPAGLSFSSASGTISGTPSATSVATTYTVTATNAAGNGTTTITVTVNPALQPPNPSYSPSSQTFTVGTAITAWTPSNAGGTAASWSINPALPAGLGFSTATGAISGTPSATSVATSYTVTASNAAGNGTTTITVTVAAAGGPPTNGLVAYWSFDEGSGTTANDSSGNGHTGTLANGPAWVQGRIGSALSFNANAMMTIASTSLTPAWTLMAWFQAPLPSTGTWHTLFRGFAGDHPIIIHPDQVSLGSYDNIGGGGFKDSGFRMSSLTAGWHLVAVVGSGEATTFFIDGNPVGSIPWQSHTDIYAIGNYQGGGQAFGTIDEARIYNRALSPSEILACFTGDSGPAAPVIAYSPSSQTFTVGTAIATWTPSNAGGTAASWSINPALPAGLGFSTATGAINGTPSASSAATTYTVTASNAGGTGTTTLTVTVNAASVAPSITTHPANATVTAGQTASFSVTASGTAPLSYQWRKNAANIAGATSASYTTPATTSADNGALYSVVVSNSAGSATSVNATLTVTSSPVPPSITTQPADQTVVEPAPATFSVVATGDAPLSYQWSKNGTAIAGATAASYTTPATATADSGSRFAVTINNAAGGIQSNNATLTVTAAPTPPSITTQPLGKTVSMGQTATFTVAATGTDPLAYQWKKNGADIAGATSASYTTPATVLADNGTQYAVTVSNPYGNATSNTVTLTVTPPVLGALTWKRDVIYLGSKEVAEIDASGVNVTLTDHLGSPRFEVRADGSVIEQKFAPFGESLTDPTTMSKFAKGFTNHEQTDPSGLIYMQARFYAPMYHRFLSPDPGLDQHFEQTQSWNIYSYVQNNPVMMTDPTGMFGWGDAWNYTKQSAQALGGYGIGLGKTAAGVVKGVATAVAHPVKTAKGIGNAVANPVQTAKAIGGAVSNAWNNANTPQQMGEFIGRAAGEAALVVAPFAKGAQAANLGKVGEVGEASSAVSGLNLSKALASEAQMGETGTSIAGFGAKSGRSIDDISRLVSQYGGDASDWSKMTSSKFTAADGTTFETRWYQNLQEGLKVEEKAKLLPKETPLPRQ